MVKDYLNQINKKETNPYLVSLRTFAEQNDVPIIRYDGLQLLIQIIKLKGVKYANNERRVSLDKS